MNEYISDKDRRIAPVVVLSHGTALAYYRTLDPANPKAARITKVDPLAMARASSDLLKTFNPEYSGFGGLPLDLLVPNRNLVRTSKRIVAHSCEVGLPDKSFWKLNESLYISSPELCFVQMAQTMSVSQLVELGVNLCSNYYIDGANHKLPMRKPITTPAKLARYVKSASSVKGVKKANRALKWVAAGSRSPMETKTYVILCFPRRYGGYGLEMATLNRKVDPGRYAYLADQGFFCIDICWDKERVGVEYFGEEDHEGAVVHDRRRLDALGALGWKMVVIDKQRLYDAESFDVAAHQIAANLNCRIRKKDGWETAHAALREDLEL